MQLATGSPCTSAAAAVKAHTKALMHLQFGNRVSCRSATSWHDEQEGACYKVRWFSIGTDFNDVLCCCHSLLWPTLEICQGVTTKIMAVLRSLLSVTKQALQSYLSIICLYLLQASEADS